MSYRLDKPYTDEQYADFIVEHNHKNGRKIEIADSCVYALEANEIMGENGEPVINPNYEAEQLKKRRDYLNQLNMTAADVERAIYKVKGLNFEDLISLVEQTKSNEIDIKALKIELNANNFYRGNPYIENVGLLLGFTSEQLDRFFESKDSNELLK